MSAVLAFVRGWFSEPAATFELRSPSPRWGTQRSHAPRRLRVTEVIDETPTVRSYVLEPLDARSPIRFLAGQHLTLLVDIDGVTHRRCYSFSSAPAADGRPSITVRRAPGGLVSRHLHETVRAGDTLLAAEPAGEFTLTTDPSASRRVAFVAGGVGITPLIGLVESLMRDEPRSRAILVCGNRCSDEIIFRDRIGALESRYAPRLIVVHALDTAPAGWTGLTGPLDGGRVIEAVGEAGADSYYVCGPEAMMNDVCESLAGAGIAAERIRTERFAYATVASTRLPAKAAEVAFEASGKRVTARPGQTILQAAIEGGVDLRYSCTMGGCGACKVKKSAGEVVTGEPNCLTESEREQGYVLACCSYPDGNVTIENH
jgi:ring-1,2-phenylacetyl-CoA epoxidase subunit PaaE